MKNNYLLDKEFLNKIDNDRNRIVYVKLISLDFDENPQEEILGRITSGSINVDGNSAVRRTCSLSLIANELDINQYYWGLKTKFKCFIGLENRVDNKYPNPIWFPMGTYLITSFSCNQALANYTISISGKDKMCLLNGDIGGTITALSVNFGEMSEQQKDGSIIKTKLLIKDIIREGVHEYARESYRNILVNDLDEAALELLEYRGKDTMYIVMDNSIGAVKQYILDPNTIYLRQIEPIGEYSAESIEAQMEQLENEYQLACAEVQADTIEERTAIIEQLTQEYETNIASLLEDLNDISNYGCVFREIQIGNMEKDQYDHRIELGLDKSQNPLRLYARKEQYNSNNYNTIIKTEYGEVIGYRLTTLTYAGDLIGSVGENFTSILDKIKNMLGDYEYFYNLEGQFVWQRRPTYINVSWNNIQQSSEQEAYAENAAYTSAVTYSFENSNLITAMQHQPDIQNIKNDYSVFGVRKTTSGIEIPVHIRYAIDQKPTRYRAWDGTIYSTEQISDEELIKIAKEFASQEYLNAILTYPKQPLPEGLSDDWWDIWDWGEYYKMLQGHYPTGNMSTYATGATAMHLEKLFDKYPSNSFPCSSATGISPGSWSESVAERRPCFLFDTLKIDGVQYLSYTGHNPYLDAWEDGWRRSCTHGYESYFMRRYSIIENYNQTHNTNYEFHAYFYKPQIPAQDQALIEERFTLLARSLANKVVDWREIIWRMADDYMKHSMVDPKYKLNPNNFELVPNLTEEQFNRSGYYIRKDKYIQADKYYSYKTYYTYNKENQTFEVVDQTGTQLTQANFNYKDIEPENQIFYYNKETTPEYVEATEFNKNTNYYKYVEYVDRLREYNPNLYPNGITGYEQYYTDVKSFWRELYDPDYIQEFKIASVNSHVIQLEGEKYCWMKNQEENPYDPEAIYYTSDLSGEWRAHSLTLITRDEFENHPDYYFLPIWQKSSFAKIELTASNYQINRYYIEKKQGEFEISNEEFDQNQTYYVKKAEAPTEEETDYIYNNQRVYYTLEEKQYYSEYEDNDITGESAESLQAEDDEDFANGGTRTRQFANRYWNKKIWEAPEKLNFWFDFLDTEGDLSKFSVKRIGDRPKAENNTNIKAVYYRETPNVIFVSTEEERNELKTTKPGYTFLSLNNNVEHLFTISSQGQSCKDKLNSLLYDCAVCKQGITLTTIPIYYLQPNTRIFITDLESGINGEYLISRLSYNLNYNGTLSITASKAVDRIY